MEAIKRTKIVDVLKSEAFGTTVNVKGWVRTRRGSKQVSFLALNDGADNNRCEYQCKRYVGAVARKRPECGDPGY